MRINHLMYCCAVVLVTASQASVFADEQIKELGKPAIQETNELQSEVDLDRKSSPKFDNSLNVQIPFDTVSGGLRWSPNGPQCSTFYKDGQSYRCIKVNDISLAVGMEQDKRYDIVRVVVDNQSNHTVDVLPANFSMLLDNEVSAPANLDDIYGSQTHKANLMSAISHGSYVPGQGYQPSYAAVGRTSGTAYATGSTVNYSGSTVVTMQRRGKITGIFAKKMVEGAEQTRALLDQQLLANTLAPGQKTSGNVVFTRKKNAQSKKTLKIVLGKDTVYF